MNSPEDIEHYHQTLIDMKEQYRKNDGTFVKVTKRNSNHVHLACTLATSLATQMEMKLVKMQVKYREDGRFQSHNLTSWPKISEMFFNNLPKIVKNTSIDWVMHPELD
jgi:hypothetical protein